MLLTVSVELLTKVLSALRHITSRPTCLDTHSLLRSIQVCLTRRVTIARRTSVPMLLLVDAVDVVVRADLGVLVPIDAFHTRSYMLNVATAINVSAMCWAIWASHTKTHACAHACTRAGRHHKCKQADREGGMGRGGGKGGTGGAGRGKDAEVASLG
jgi:hypothetical protein